MTATKSNGIFYVWLAIVVCTTLAFGLVPYDSYADKWVEWDESSKATKFGQFGYVHGDFPELSELHGTNNNLEVKLTIVPQDGTEGTFQVISHIGSPDDPNPLIIGQWRKFLIVMQGYDFRHEEKLPRLTTNIENWIGKPTDVRVLFNDSVNTMYIAGKPVSTHSPSTYALEKTDARIAIGNTPNGKHGWTGAIENFTVTFQDTTAITSDVLRDYDFAIGESVETIVDLSDHEAALSVPPIGQFQETLFLNNRPLKELLKSKPIDLIVNLLGFIPLGFVAAFAIARRFSVVSAVIVALIIGTSVTLSIEFVQQYIPGRSSDLHDFILNMSGLVLGIGAYLIYHKYFKQQATIEEDDGQVVDGESIEVNLADSVDDSIEPVSETSGTL